MSFRLKEAWVGRRIPSIKHKIKIIFCQSRHPGTPTPIPQTRFEGNRSAFAGMVQLAEMECQPALELCQAVNPKP